MTAQPAPAAPESTAKCQGCGHEAHEPSHCQHVDFGRPTACGSETFHCYCKGGRIRELLEIKP